MTTFLTFCQRPVKSTDVHLTLLFPKGAIYKWQHPFYPFRTPSPSPHVTQDYLFNDPPPFPPRMTSFMNKYSNNPHDPIWPHATPHNPLCPSHQSSTVGSLSVYNVLFRIAIQPHFWSHPERATVNLTSLFRCSISDVNLAQCFFLCCDINCSP